MRKQRRKQHWKHLALIIILILVVGLSVFYVRHRQSTTNTQASQASQLTKKGVNLSPPTDSDKTATQEHKKSLAQSIDDGQSSEASQPANNTGQHKQAVTPVITTWGSSSDGTSWEVNGYIQGVVESGGTCTLTLTKGGQTVTTSKSGTSNATNTTCGIMPIPYSRLSAGDWQATLTYTSTSSIGTSSPTAMEISP